MTIYCPKCDGEINGLVSTPWGKPTKGAEALRFAPYLCGWCASLLIIDFDAKRLCTLEAIDKLTGGDILAVMIENAALWSEITQAQKRILALPNRRKVKECVN
jgi:hypothetical protein